MSTANSHHLMRLHRWAGMALLVALLVGSLALLVEGRSAGPKPASFDDIEPLDDTSDYLDDGELNAALTGAKAPTHHHHIHVHPKASVRTTRRPAPGKTAECDCSKNKAAPGASRTSPVDPLQDFTTTTTTTTTEAPDDWDDFRGSRADLAEEDDLTDDYMEDNGGHHGGTRAPAGKSRSADDLDDADGPATTSAKPIIVDVPDDANTTVASTTEAPATAKPAITIKPIQLDQSAGGDDDNGDS